MSHTPNDIGHTSFAPGLDTDKPLPPQGTEADQAAAAVGIQGVAPPSQVADTVYPNVPETTEPQQAASGPGQGTVFDDPNAPNPKFKDQVNGYAKKIAGTVFRNDKEVQLGKELLGEAPLTDLGASKASSGVEPPQEAVRP